MQEEKNIVFKATEKQQQFIDAVMSAQFTVLAFGGAIRGGKTFVALAIAIILCKVFPGSRWTIVRKDLKRLRENTRPSLNKFISGSKVKINESAQTFLFENGSMILFKGENYDKDKTLESFKGHETNGFILEEVSETREETFNKCLERAGSYIITPEPTAGQPPPFIIMTCNPTQTWIKRLIYDPWKKGELPNHIFYLPSYVTDNPYLPKAYLDNLKNLPLYEYEVFVKGNWDIALKVKNAFWHALEPGIHVSYKEYDPGTIIHISIDANVMPYCSASIWQIYPDIKTVVQIGEITAKDPYNHAAGLGSEVISYLDNLGYNDVLHIYGDATTKSQNAIDEKRRSFFDIFMETLSEKYHATSFVGTHNPQIAKTGEFVNAMYSGFNGWRVIISEVCKESLSDYLTVKKDMDGTMQKKRVTDEDGNSYEQYGHMSDTKRYFFYECLNSVYYEWENRFSEPAEAIPIDVLDSGNIFDE